MYSASELFLSESKAFFCSPVRLWRRFFYGFLGGDHCHRERILRIFLRRLVAMDLSYFYGGALYEDRWRPLRGRFFLRFVLGNKASVAPRRAWSGVTGGGDKPLPPVWLRLFRVLAQGLTRKNNRAGQDDCAAEDGALGWYTSGSSQTRQKPLPIAPGKLCGFFFALSSSVQAHTY